MRKFRSFVFIFFGLFGLFTFFLGLQKVQAASENIVITEVMYNPSGTDTAHEWVEILNLSDSGVEISNWKFSDGSNHNLTLLQGETEIQVASGEYLILASDRETFLLDYPVYQGRVIDTVMALNNTTDTTSLIGAQGSIIDELTYDSAWGASDNGRSLEKKDPEAANTASNYQESFVLAGTPGNKASEFIMPDYPAEVFELVDFEYAVIKSAKVTSIIDGDTIGASGLTGFSSTIRFLAVDSAEAGENLFEPAKEFTSELNGKTIDLIISQAEDEQFDRYGRTLAVVIYNNQVFNTQLLERGIASYYDTDNLVLKNVAWQAIEESAQGDKIGLWASLEGSSVILSELLPNPIGSDEDEWIEFYNPLSEQIDLSYFLLDRYLIPYGTRVTPKNWLIFSRSQTGITLNNAGDTIRLFFPDGLLADEVTYPKGSEGFSWAFANGQWQWTTKPTPAKLNSIVVPVIEEDESGNNAQEEDIKIPINSEVKEIKTGDYKNWQNYLVKVRGEVVETSGNTFYLDDGSGRAKIYIQAATGIDKPEMHKGDIFEIVGIVNLYRDTWRILPQNQDDIKLIQAAQDEIETTSTAVKKSSTATTAKKSTSSTASKNTPTSSAKKVASASNQNPSSNIQESPQVAGYKTPLWIQFIKVSTGLAAILLLLLGVRFWQIRKSKDLGGPLGGNFGDYT